MKSNKKTVKYIDYTIFFFIVLFLASLTNSIFINQVGYYGDLVFILCRYFYTKENQFLKTGLEIFFLLFIVAELLSALFSVNQSQAFHNLLKRILLIPIIYTITVAAGDMKKAKLFTKIFLFFAVLSSLIYVYNSYTYFVSGLFQFTGSGPSLFQYPITTSELFSFSSIFLFAFLINEKTNWKSKLLILLSFSISLIALIATYKRTGWIGFAAGIVTIIVLKKKYFYLIPFAVLVIILMIYEKNESMVYVYKNSDNRFIEQYRFSTEGRASNVYPLNDEYLVCDYENGLVRYKDSLAQNKLEVPQPILSIKRWRDNYYCARLVDTRFLLLQEDQNSNFNIIDEFLTSGFTRDYYSANNCIYVIDRDSGLTVFRNPLDLNDTVRFKDEVDYRYVAADSNYLVLYSVAKGVKIYQLKNNLPREELDFPMLVGPLNFAQLIDGNVLFSDESGYKLFSPHSNKTKSLNSERFPQDLIRVVHEDGKLFFMSLGGNIVEIVLPFTDTLKVLTKMKVGFNPSGVTYRNNSLYLTKVKSNRLTSIWDPYQPSNTVRLALWKVGWEIFKDYPLFGVGDIDLADLYKKYKNEYDKEIQGHLHNNYIHILVILGAFGFIVVMILLSKILFFNFRIYNSLKSVPFASSFSLGVIGSFIAFLMAGLTEMNFGDHEIITMVWFMVGMNYAFYFVNVEK
jgi:O-antigen ligase